MEPKVGERIFALSAVGAFKVRLRRRRWEVPASAVVGENARMWIGARHRRELRAAVVLAVVAVVVGYGVVVPRTVRRFRRGYFWRSGTQGGMRVQRTGSEAEECG